MPGHPADLADRPVALDEKQIDVLSEVLDSLRVATLVHARLELSAPWGIVLPRDDAALLLVVVRGAGQLHGDGARKPKWLSAGDVVLLPHGGAHRLRDAEATAYRPLDDTACAQLRSHRRIRIGGKGPETILVACAFQFRAAHRGHAIRRLPRCIHLRVDQAHASPWLATTVQLVGIESGAHQPGATIIMKRLADVLLVQTLRAFIASAACTIHGLPAVADPQIGRALGLIHERPDGSWTVARLASRVAMSRSAFAARFRALVGEPPLEYATRWRITRAAQLLRDGELTTSEIAARAGYRSEAAFQRAFKRLEGVAPGTYRRTASRRRPGR